MNCYSIPFAFSVFVLVTINVLAFDDSYQNEPLILEFSQQADLIIIGRVGSHSRSSDDSGITEIEIERIISAVWEEKEIVKHLKSDGQTSRLKVLENMRLSSANNIIMAHGRPGDRFLCWLKLVKDKGAPGLDLSEYFIPVSVPTGFDSAELGLLKLSYLQKLLSPEVHKGMQEIGGKDYDPRLAADRAMRRRFGTADREELVRIACLFSKMMSVCKDTEEERQRYEELRRLSHSQEKIISEIATLLLKMGTIVQRFQFVDISRN